MATWRTSAPSSSTHFSYLRLGTYVDDESALAPSQYPANSFSGTDGILMSTTGDVYISAEPVDIEIQDDVTILVGDYSSDTDKDLQMDVLDGGNAATFKGSGISFSAVSDQNNQKDVVTNELILYSADKMTIDASGQFKLHASGNVSVTNKESTEWNSTEQSFTMGFVNSIISGMQMKIVPGLYCSSMTGLRIQIRIDDHKISLLDISYNNVKNELVGKKTEFKGVAGVAAAVFSGAGLIAYNLGVSETKKDTTKTEAKGVSSNLDGADVKDETISVDLAGPKNKS